VGFLSPNRLGLIESGQAWINEQITQMTRVTVSVFVGLLGLALPAHAAQFKFPDQTLTVPDGFEVELVAGPPLVDRPVTADFDEQGRLYVTDSSGSNEKPDKQLQEKPHRIVRLEDTDGDGHFDKSTVFADRMMFPEGCLWYHGSLYVAAPPSIWKLTDTDGDGIVDHREEWFQGKTLTGCANDLHGPYCGPDGWIYWCKGAFATQTYERPGKPPFVTRAAHIFRSRPDGSGIEPVMTGGMDNPVSVTFTPGGEPILTGTFFVHPGGGKRDGLIHAVYGGVYGKDHDVIYDHKRTGDLMPIMTHHGPAASCFVLRYESDAFGQEYRDNLFACLFNLHKVMRHVLLNDGATFKTRDEDFLSSDNPDFHPTDVVEDADGSLLVVDTGGWYKICCPTSQLWKPDVLGAIYRVRRVGAPKLDDPRGLKIAWNTAEPEVLVNLLNDPRPAVRHRAVAELGQKGAAAIPALRKALDSSQAPLTQLNAVWALTRIEAPEARAAVHQALRAKDANVVSAALHSISTWRDKSAPMKDLTDLLVCSNPQLRRVAAEALGRRGDPEAVRFLLSSAALKSVDRVLEHSIIYALIEIDDRAQTVPGLAVENSSSRRAALIALDQMDHGQLSADEVTPLLGSTDPVLKQTASWIVSHHPEWARSLAGFFQNRLLASDLTDEARAELQRQLGEFSREAVIQHLLADILNNPAASSASRLTVLRAMAGAHLRTSPPGWIDGLVQILATRDPRLTPDAVKTARELAVPAHKAVEFAGALEDVARQPTLPVETRLEALESIPGGLSQVEAPDFDFLRANLDLGKPVMVRSAAANTLAKSKLNEAQLTELTECIKGAGPLEVPKLLAAFEKATNEALGLQLVAALSHSTGLSSLRAETVLPRLTNFPSVVQEDARKLLASLNTDAAAQRAHLDELMPILKNGDVRRGQFVFNSQKAACSTCHAIGYLGGNIGPDLTRIGQVRTEGDLLESIVYPSASFVRSFEPIVVMTKSGDDYSGVVKQDSPDELVLATGPGPLTRIARSEIAEIRPGTVSIMPAGLDQLLTRQELADLVAFLRATRW
jgi:putative membrane-bound dehydrogenase-like protein